MPLLSRGGSSGHRFGLYCGGIGGERLRCGGVFLLRQVGQNVEHRFRCATGRAHRASHSLHRGSGRARFIVVLPHCMDGRLPRCRGHPRHRAGRDWIGQAAGSPVLGRRHGGKAAARVVRGCRLRRRGAGGRRGSCLGPGGLSLSRLLLAVVPVLHGESALPAAGGSEGVAHRTVDRIKDVALPGKADLGLGGVYVDVHQLGGQREHEDAAGELALHQGTLVGVFHGGHHGAVFDVAAVDIERLRAAGGTAGTGRRDQAGHADRRPAPPSTGSRS